jgi:hypothetical protein
MVERSVEDHRLARLGILRSRFRKPHARFTARMHNFWCGKRHSRISLTTITMMASPGLPARHCPAIIAWSHLSMARSPFSGAIRPLASIARQVLTPLPAAYSSARVCAYPALRFPGLPTALHNIAPRLPVVGCGTRSAYRRTHFLHRRPSGSLSLSQVWRTNDHQTAHCRRNPTSFSTTDKLCSMKLLSPTPTLRAFLAAANPTTWLTIVSEWIGSVNTSASPGLILS